VCVRPVCWLPPLPLSPSPPPDSGIRSSAEESRHERRKRGHEDEDKGGSDGERSESKRPREREDRREDYRGDSEEKTAALKVRASSPVVRIDCAPLGLVVATLGSVREAPSPHLPFFWRTLGPLKGRAECLATKLLLVDAILMEDTRP